MLVHNPAAGRPRRRSGGHLLARRRAGRPQRAAPPGGAGQVQLPPRPGRADLRRAGHRRGPLPHRQGEPPPSSPSRSWEAPPLTRCASALSVHPVAASATGEVAAPVLEALGPAPDLVVLFADPAPHRRPRGRGRRRPPDPATRPPGGLHLGVSLGGAQEIEDGPALSLCRPVRPGDAAGGPVRPGGLPAVDGPTIVGLPSDHPGRRTGAARRSVHLPTASAPTLGPSRPHRGRRDGLGRLLRRAAIASCSTAPCTTTVPWRSCCRPVARRSSARGAARSAPWWSPERPATSSNRWPASRPSAAAPLVESSGPRSGAGGVGAPVRAVVDERAETFGGRLPRAQRARGGARSAPVAMGDQAAVGNTVQFQVRDARPADEELRPLLGGATPGRRCSSPATAGHEPVRRGRATTPSGRGGRRGDGGMFCAGEIGPDRSPASSCTASRRRVLFDPLRRAASPESR